MRIFPQSCSQVQAKQPSVRGQYVSQILHYSLQEQHGFFLQQLQSEIIENSLMSIGLSEWNSIQMIIQIIIDSFPWTGDKLLFL